MEQTSTEILKAMQVCDKINSGECSKIAELLTTADYVKFAKFTPLQDENSRYLDSVYDFVNTTHQRLLAEKAEQEKKEAEERKLCEIEEKKTTDIAGVNNNREMK